MKTETVAGQPSWRIENDTVSASVTHLGGMIAPVEFQSDPARPVSPYYVSPWQGETPPPEEPVLAPLRGDFFCLPFGAESTVNGRRYVTHGDTATRQWELVEDESGKTGETTTLTVRMRSAAPAGEVIKRISLRNGDPVVYNAHELTGFGVRAPLGHHATLAADPDAPLKITTSPIRFGMTAPGPEEPYGGGEYSALLPASEFSSLESVPTRWKNIPDTDCSIFPAREGFVDIMAVFQRHPESGEPTWVAAVSRNARFLWFSLKDPTVLPTTVLWMENLGRHQPPWNGRNRCIGLEDVCGYFAQGLAESVETNALSERGIPTVIELTPDRKREIRYIQGAAPIPEGFGSVASATFKDDRVVFSSPEGATVDVPVRWSYLFGEDPT